MHIGFVKDASFSIENKKQKTQELKENTTLRKNLEFKYSLKRDII